MTKTFRPLLLATEDGEKTIVNMSSIAGHRIREGSSSCGTTKYAMMRFTEYLNVDYGRQGIMSYCIHPGAVLTELARSLAEFSWKGKNFRISKT